MPKLIVLYPPPTDVTKPFASTVATAVSAPLVAWTFGRVSLVGPLTNLIASPLMGLAQPMLFLGLLVAPFPSIARLVGDAVHPLLVAFDGIMALQPHWFSNLLGGFYFMGSFLGAHMLLALMMIYGSAHLKIADLVSPKQRHDLGKLCFGFTVFWTYLMWAQFLVIWYGNLPEETGFVFARLW